MTTETKLDVNVKVRISEAEERALKAIADREQRSVSNVIRLAIQGFIAKEGRKRR